MTKKRLINEAGSTQYLRDQIRCIGIVVRELRTEKDLTQREVAERGEIAFAWWNKSKR
jgi:hypothetical protein